jgi:hypothetical protein
MGAKYNSLIKFTVHIQEPQRIQLLKSVSHRSCQHLTSTDDF